MLELSAEELMLSNCGAREDSWVLWTARRSNQSILKGINPEYSLEELILKLKFQSFGPLMWRTDSFEKTLMLGKIEGRRVGGHHQLNGHEFEQTPEDNEGRVACHAVVHGVTKGWTWLSNRTITTESLGNHKNYQISHLQLMSNSYFFPNGSSSHVLFLLLPRKKLLKYPITILPLWRCTHAWTHTCILKPDYQTT